MAGERLRGPAAGQFRKRSSFIVTGSASGIGFAAASLLLRWNAEVVIADVRADALVASVALLERGLPFDGLVNSAGITGQTGIPTQEVRDDDFARVLSVNVMGSFLLTKAVLPHLVSRKYGRILHIASIAGKEGTPRMSAYSTSKGAVIGFVKTVAREYALSGVTVNAIAASGNPDADDRNSPRGSTCHHGSAHTDRQVR